MAQLDTQRRLTREFIAYDPTAIILIPTVVTAQSNGGSTRVDGPPRVSQQFKLIPMSHDRKPVVTVDGVDRMIDYTLLGEWDSSMELWDHWEGSDGSTFTIVAFADGMDYQKKGLVERRLPGR